MKSPRMPHPPTALLQATVLLVGLCYLALGLAGFTTKGTGMGPDPTRTVWVFGVSALLNIGHTGVGVLGVAAVFHETVARAYGWLSFFAFTGLFAYSILAVTLSSTGNLANVRPANVWLYAVTAVLGLLVSVTPVRQPVTGHAT